ncbi:MAG: L,D-transpeptidase family protein [Acidimicrobiaceae bacterium]|nr:L,D-transpeptidase family protein [Acidimicrobiaceae bacterium]
MNLPLNSPRQESAFDRWRPALVAFAILATVIAIGVLRSENDDVEAVNSISPDVVVESSLVPLVTVPLSRTLEIEMEGDDVQRVQQRLKDLRFDPGPVDGVFGQNTMQAMWAFEKLVLGVPAKHATGVVTPSTWAIMQTNLKFKPRRIADTPTHVEIYLPEQVLIVFTNQEPVLITHISSGSGEPWCDEVTIDPGEDGNPRREDHAGENDNLDLDGQLINKQIKVGICGISVTTPGIFYFYNRRTGTRETKLGTLYNPVYFNYGLAIHGAILVPLKPVSHGCVRIPMSVARYFPALVKYGDRVYVFDGIKEPEEYGSPVPPFDTPDPNYTTTSVVATSLPVQTTIPISVTSTIVSTTVPKSTSTTTTVLINTSTSTIAP